MKSDKKNMKTKHGFTVGVIIGWVGLVNQEINIWETWENNY